MDPLCHAPSQPGSGSPRTGYGMGAKDGGRRDAENVGRMPGGLVLQPGDLGRMGLESSPMMSLSRVWRSREMCSSMIWISLISSSRFLQRRGSSDFFFRTDHGMQRSVIRELTMHIHRCELR